MKKENEIIFINEPESEYIDKIIVILNSGCKNLVTEEKITEQAERIIREYNSKNNNNEVKKLYKKGLIFGVLIMVCIAALAFKVYF